jgi:integrin alpha FG-GAP repeat containing protein 1
VNARLTIKGTLDILVQRSGDQGAGTVTFVRNNFYQDAFFIKAQSE